MDRVLGILKAAYNFFSGDAIILTIVAVAFIAAKILDVFVPGASANVIAAVVFIVLILASITATLARERAGRVRRS
jgi:hypothetical protein